MKSRRMAVAATGVLAALALSTGAAFASGGTSTGGGSTGGSGSGGGGGGGGGTTTTVAPATSCATITSFSNSTGYYSVWAAIWTSFAISDSCGYAVNWSMTYTNGNTGLIDFSRGSSTAYMNNGTIDEDWAAFSTPYTVALTVTDPSGTVLDTRSALVTTKPPKTPGA